MPESDPFLVRFSMRLSQTAGSRLIQDELWIIPLVQTVHILAIAALVSGTALLVLRSARHGPGHPIPGERFRYAGWIWGGLAVAAASGTILLIGEPLRSLPNPVFHLKMILLLVALGFALGIRGRLAGATFAAAGERGGLALTGLVLAIWIAMIIAGRWIAYVPLHVYLPD